MAAAVGAGARNECTLLFCTLWTENGQSVFCQSHTTRWRNAGSPDIDEFVAGCEQYARPAIDFRGLPAQLSGPRR